ncbi:MAG: hypothetical protein D8G53_10365 [Candidatus Saccharimonas sp.]|nr:MAG: hypothetical protein D8G53_10365 [Candidatus Saccharimonas sp.]
MIRLVRLNEVRYVASEFEASLLIDEGFVAEELEEVITPSLTDEPPTDEPPTDEPPTDEPPTDEDENPKGGKGKGNGGKKTEA